MLLLEPFLTGWFASATALHAVSALQKFTKRDFDPSWRSDFLYDLVSAVFHGIILAWIVVTWWL
ncbi:MAG: hypothetical protein DRJ38_00315 [Thermoprotei archaeon]|nr:MAG: hypothetical protein DRJ38_00315 [Thermoprotei archaeon]